MLERNNLNQAYLQVVRNKGVAGADGMTTDQLLPLKEHREELLVKLRQGTYKPQPVLRVEIPKPNGGVRKLGNSHGYRSYASTGNQSSTTTAI